MVSCPPPLPPQLEEALRERCFGDHEMASCGRYKLVWAEDAKATSARFGAAAAGAAAVQAGLMAGAAAAPHPLAVLAAPSIVGSQCTASLENPTSVSHPSAAWPSVSNSSALLSRAMVACPP
jgi:hypothetical protein